MTIEEEFFKTFGITSGSDCKSRVSVYDCAGECEGCDYQYPEITAERLLELICILINKESPITFEAGYEPIKIKNLKNLVLQGCIKYSEELTEQVRKVFEGV